MDKGQLPAEKLMNPAESKDDNGCNNDDVAASAKKEKLQELLPLHDTTPIQHSSAVQAHKLTTRGKDITDKKQDVKTSQEADTEELLGSVTTYNCHGTRTSARVIQKMRQDQQTRPITPPPSERDPGRKEERSASQKTPSQVRANRPTWSNIERNHFFDALNEFGKDFEAIGNFINTKLKRRSPATDISFKSKDQVRQHYYQTYHKICKYIRFSEEVRKPVQELYALINYGEMRRKLQFVTDKHFMKLRNLIYHGHITVRCKGKNIRIKTPSCKALRRLNQLDDSLEDIRLPSKIEVIISPANMEAFGRVQSTAQNPRCRTTVPLHKKLVNFIKTFQHKWRSMDVRIAEEAKIITTQEPTTTSTQSQISHTAANDFSVQESEMCFLPKPGVTIHRPLLSITEYLSSVNICLTAYEERMGVKIKGEHLNSDRCTSANLNVPTSTNNSNISITCKRVRTESGSEKRSPEQMKKVKQADNNNTCDNAADDTQLLNNSFQIAKNESSSDELSDELQELLSDSNEINNSKEYQTIQENHNLPLPPPPPSSTTSTEILQTSYTSQLNTAARSKRSLGSKTSRAASFKPLLNDDVIQTIRSGWTSSTAADITIGDLYVVFGQDSKLQLDYYWTPLESQATNLVKQHLTTTSKLATNCASRSAASCDDENLQKSLHTSDLSNRLKQLLLIANLNEHMRRRPCACERNNAAKVKFERDFIANKSPLNNGVVNIVGSDKNSNIFRKPMIPIRRTSIDPVKQLTTLTRQKMSRPVLVQRLLLPSNVSANTGTQHVSHTIQTFTMDTSTAMPANISAVNINNNNNNKIVEDDEVPWTLADKCYTQTARTSTIPTTTTIAITATTTTITSTTSCSSSSSSITTASNQNSHNQITSNSQTFLNALPVTDYEEMPQSSTSHYQQQFKNYDQLNVEKAAADDGLSPGMQSADSAFDEISNTSFLNGLTPMHLLRETSSNSKWLEDNINDFSLTSLLGHLDEINSNRDMLDSSSNLSVISESSVDYMHKFQEIKALLQNQEKD